MPKNEIQPSEHQIKWTVKEYIGSPICKPNQLNDLLSNESDIQNGSIIWVPGFNGYYEMTVKKDEYGKLYAEGQKLIAILEFAEDDRKCWICGGLINSKAIKIKS